MGHRWLEVWRKDWYKQHKGEQHPERREGGGKDGGRKGKERERRLMAVSSMNEGNNWWDSCACVQPSQKGFIQDMKHSAMVNCRDIKKFSVNICCWHEYIVISKTLVCRIHGSGKTVTTWGVEEWQNVNVDNVCRKMFTVSLFPTNVYRLKTAPLQRALLTEII